MFQGARHVAGLFADRQHIGHERGEHLARSQRPGDGGAIRDPLLGIPDFGGDNHIADGVFHNGQGLKGRDAVIEQCGQGSGKIGVGAGGDDSLDEGSLELHPVPALFSGWSLECPAQENAAADQACESQPSVFQKPFAHSDQHAGGKRQGTTQFEENGREFRDDEDHGEDHCGKAHE